MLVTVQSALEAKPTSLAPLSPPLTVLVHLPHVKVDLVQMYFTGTTE